MAKPTSSGTGIGGLSTPDITPAQIAAVIQAVIAVAVAFGLDISDSERQALIGLSAAVAAVLGIADAIIRHGRAGAAARQRETAMPVPGVGAATTGAEAPPGRTRDRRSG